VGNVDKEAIRQVIEKAYIQGIHGNQDAKTVKGGFHRDFAMLVLKDNTLEKVTVDRVVGKSRGDEKGEPRLMGGGNATHF
jgi:hypothetical protein